MKKEKYVSLTVKVLQCTARITHWLNSRPNISRYYLPQNSPK